MYRRDDEKLQWEAKRYIKNSNTWFLWRIGFELEIELIQTQMEQKPMLREEVYPHAMHAS